jgi:hypothetical protein
LEHCCIYKISKEFAKINNKLKQIQNENWIIFWYAFMR